MIVRIMGEGQREVDDSDIDVLDSLDDELQRAVDGGDEAVFRNALTSLLDRVREIGRPLEAESLEPSDLLLPHAEASLVDVRDMLGEEGLIPG